MDIGVTWLAFTHSMLFYAVAALLTALEWMRFYPEILDEVEDPILAVSIAALIGVAIVASAKTIKPE